MQNEVLNFRYNFDGYWGKEGVCDIFIDKKNDTLIISELFENLGASIYNASESIVTSLYKQYALNPYKLIWIENFGRKSESNDADFQIFRGGREEYTLVKFKFSNDKFIIQERISVSEKEFSLMF